MDRCALFVDAGYVLADGAMAVHGTRQRESVSWDYAGLVQLLSGLADRALRTSRAAVLLVRGGGRGPPDTQITTCLPIYPALSSGSAACARAGAKASK